ncbi:MAG: tRNA (adenosine(37)-N6)-dimethylallyltransferase MiaA [Lachnospiraceae bacterium]
MGKKSLVVLTGPTAVGKTELSIGLAKQINGEIISADSMQVYKYMNIGTAKIKKEEMDGIKHYLVDELDPTDEFNIVRFQQMAKEAMEEIWAKGKIPIIVGGTGFYIQSIVYDINFSKEKEENGYRRELEKIAREKGGSFLHEELKKVDPISAEKIHPNNIKKVIRALEYYKENNAPISAHNEEQMKKESPYHFAYFVLNRDRKILYERIDKRVDLMIEEGLLEEVRELKKRGYTKNLVSMQGLGYKEILDYLDGECSLENAIYRLKRDTRHFAKRQLTWFRREKETIFVEKDKFLSEKEILSYMIEKLREKKVL